MSETTKRKVDVAFELDNDVVKFINLHVKVHSKKMDE